MWFEFDKSQCVASDDAVVVAVAAVVIAHENTRCDRREGESERGGEKNTLLKFIGPCQLHAYLAPLILFSSVSKGITAKF